MFSCGDLMLSIVTDPDILLCNSKKYPRDTTMWFLIIIILWWLWCIICIYIYMWFDISYYHCTVPCWSMLSATIRLLSDYYQITIRLLSPSCDLEPIDSCDQCRTSFSAATFTATCALIPILKLSLSGSLATKSMKPVCFLQGDRRSVWIGLDHENHAASISSFKNCWVSKKWSLFFLCLVFQDAPSQCAWQGL